MQPVRLLQLFAAVVVVAWFLGTVGVEAHGRLVMPLPRGERNGHPQYVENEPVPSTTSKFVCRDDPGDVPLVTLTAGATTKVQWQLTALHVGDCFMYLSYDLALPDTQKRWFKIAQWFDCKAYSGQNVSLTIPSYLPSCTHCIMRWEWYALHLYPGAVEYYDQCVDVVIDGSTPGALPNPQVTIPGNLPTDPTAYRDPWTAGASQFFTGPAMASLSGAPPPSSSPLPPSSSRSSSSNPPSSSSQAASSSPSPSTEQQQQPSTEPSLPVPPSSTVPSPSTLPSSQFSATTSTIASAEMTCGDRCKDICDPEPVASCRCTGDDVTATCSGAATVNMRVLSLSIVGLLLLCCKLL